MPDHQEKAVSSEQAGGSPAKQSQPAKYHNSEKDWINAKLLIPVLLLLFLGFSILLITLGIRFTTELLERQATVGQQSMENQK